MVRLPRREGRSALRLLYAQPPPLHCGRALTSQLSPVATLPPPQTPSEDLPAHGLLQLNGGVKASGACAESEGMARVYDFPSSLRCVAVRVAASDAVKASHIQRSPLSMGGLCEPGRAISKSKKKGDCAGSLCVRCNSASGLTLGGSVPKRDTTHRIRAGFETSGIGVLCCGFCVCA